MSDSVKPNQYRVYGEWFVFGNSASPGGYVLASHHFDAAGRKQATYKALFCLAIPLAPIFLYITEI
jgi:hypothetical protein